MCGPNELEAPVVGKTLALTTPRVFVLDGQVYVVTNRAIVVLGASDGAYDAAKSDAFATLAELEAHPDVKELVKPQTANDYADRRKAAEGMTGFALGQRVRWLGTKQLGHVVGFARVNLPGVPEPVRMLAVHVDGTDATSPYLVLPTKLDDATPPLGA